MWLSLQLTAPARRSRRWGLLAAGLCLATACGGAARTGSGSDAPSEDAPSDGVGRDGADGIAPGGAEQDDIATPDAMGASPGQQDAPESPLPASDPGTAEQEPRELVYRVRPDGLLIEYDGLSLRPRAEAQRLSNGGYGIRLTVSYEPSPEAVHELRLSEGSPLSVYAKIFDKAGNQKATVADTRRASDTVDVCVDCPSEPWQAVWPRAEGTPLWWGERVVLEVGLWGIGLDETDRRPMKRLFLVEYRAGDSSDPVVRPPQF